ASSTSSPSPLKPTTTSTCFATVHQHHHQQQSTRPPRRHYSDTFYYSSEELNDLFGRADQEEEADYLHRFELYLAERDCLAILDRMEAQRQLELNALYDEVKLIEISGSKKMKEKEKDDNT